MKITLKNTALVSVGGHLPGETFRVDAINEKTPKERFWRKMLKNGDGVILVKTEEKEEKRETLTLKSNQASPKASTNQKTPAKKDEAA